MVYVRPMLALLACSLLLASSAHDCAGDPDCVDDKDMMELLQDKVKITMGNHIQKDKVKVKIGKQAEADMRSHGGWHDDDDEEGGGEEEGGEGEGGDGDPAYDKASDIFAGETQAEYKARMDDMIAKWNARPKGKNVVDFNVGDDLCLCMKGEEACPNSCDGSLDSSGEDRCYPEHGKVAKVFTRGVIAIDYQDGLTGFEKQTFDVDGPTRAIVCEGATQKCKKKEFFLDVQGNPLGGKGKHEVSPCVDSCPPGFIATAAGEIDHPSGAGGVCAPCYGRSTRRRTATYTADDTCYPCAAGYVSNPSSDECQNVQDLCDKEQCGPCASCLQLLAPEIQKCADKSDESCYNPGRTWCSGAQEKLMRCQAKSLGCFYKLACHSGCVCNDWKQAFCGGKVGNTPCAISLRQNENSSLDTTIPREVEKQDALALDQALAGKRTC